MCLRGEHRMAAALFVQFGAYLRPGELLEGGLIRDSVVLPEFIPASHRRTCYLLLGTHGRTTKNRREQTVEIACPIIIIAVLRKVISQTVTGQTLFPFSYQTYYKAIQAAASAQGLASLGFTPHSKRAGGATQDLMDGKDFNHVQNKGRWANQHSCRIYLDRAMALAGATIEKSIPFHILLAKPHLVGDIFLLSSLS